MRRRRRTVSMRATALALGVGAALVIAGPILWLSAGASQSAGSYDAGPRGVAIAMAATTAGAPEADSGPVRSTGTTTITSATTARSRSTTTATSSAATSGPTRRPASRGSDTPEPVRTGHGKTTAPSAAPSASASAPAPAPISRSVDRAGAKAAAPTRLRIDALGVDTSIVPVGVDDDGAMAVPEDVATAGWYRFGPAPGAVAGSAVLAGHVDSRQQGIGVFHALWSIEPGTLIHVDRAGAPSLTYRVVSRESFTKSELPLTAVFGTGGAARLTLVTCGGAFDQGARSYLDNVVVTAVPA